MQSQRASPGGFHLTRTQRPQALVCGPVTASNRPDQPLASATGSGVSAAIPWHGRRRVRRREAARFRPGRAGLTAYTGLRRAEIAGLPWSEVDLDAGLITVRETRLDDDADPEDPKSEAGERPVALSAMLVTPLRYGGSSSSRSAWRGASVAGQRPRVH